MFSRDSLFRKVIISITESQVFDNFIILLIGLNSLGLVMTDYADRNNSTDWNKGLELASLVFSILFMIECILKIISMGFVVHYNSYLRDAWNWIDFAVVMVSIAEMTPFM